MDKRNFAFDRVNFMLIGISMLIVIVGFILMSGGGSTEEKFDPEIFNTMHYRSAYSMLHRFRVDDIRSDEKT